MGTEWVKLRQIVGNSGYATIQITVPCNTKPERYGITKICAIEAVVQISSHKGKARVVRRRA